MYVIKIEMFIHLTSNCIFHNFAWNTWSNEEIGQVGNIASCIPFLNTGVMIACFHSNHSCTTLDRPTGRAGSGRVRKLIGNGGSGRVG